MKRITSILKNKTFRVTFAMINNFEAERPFCRHDIAHSLAVARIAFILSLEENAGIPKEIIYASAILHDIGRAEEYSIGAPHNIAAERPATDILHSTGFSEEEISVILTAILTHRSDDDNDTNILSDILFRADKLSRPCYNCDASANCKWDDKKKNKYLLY